MSEKFAGIPTAFRPLNGKQKKMCFNIIFLIFSLDSWKCAPTRDAQEGEENAAEWDEEKLITAEAKKRQQQVLYGECRNLCMWKSSLRKKNLYWFSAQWFFATRVFSSHLQTRQNFPVLGSLGEPRVYSEAGEREEMAKKEIFCSCVLHRGASHYKANTRHTFAHFSGWMGWGGRL